MRFSTRRISKISKLEIVTSRAGNSNTSPARTRACARSPSTFTAETELGRCAIVPRILANSLSIAASVTAETSAVEVISPS